MITKDLILKIRENDTADQAYKEVIKELRPVMNKYLSKVESDVEKEELELNMIDSILKGIYAIDPENVSNAYFNTSIRNAYLDFIGYIGKDEEGKIKKREKPKVISIDEIENLEEKLPSDKLDVDEIAIQDIIDKSCAELSVIDCIILRKRMDLFSLQEIADSLNLQGGDWTKSKVRDRIVYHIRPIVRKFYTDQRSKISV